MIEYQIKNKQEIIIGIFQNRIDRDNALKFTEYGIPCEENKGDKE